MSQAKKRPALTREKLEKINKPLRAIVQQAAKNIATHIGRCPTCKSRELEYGVSPGPWIPKPYVSCKSCGEILVL